MPQSILIVEEDPSCRNFLAAGLVDAGFRVLEAADLALAARLFLRHDPDLVLLDPGANDQDGMDMLRNMKKVRPNVPVIIVSGRTRITDAIEAFKAGAWDYVIKPITSLDVFITNLCNCLTQARLRTRVRNTQEHLFRLIQNLPIIIFSINRNLEFEFLNRSTEQILGYPPHEILESPRPFLKHIVPEDRKKFTDALKLSLGPEAREFRLEFRFVHKNGYQVTLQAQSIAPSRTDGGLPDRVEGMIVDVTRTAYMDSILLQNEKLSLLRAVTEEVAHEIRTPLVSLGGFARQLRARFPEAGETEVIMEECARLERLVQRIGAYLEPMHVNLTRCSVPAALSFAMRLLSSRLERKAVSCDVDLDDSLPPALADSEVLHRICIYLVGHGANIVEPSGSMHIGTTQTSGLVQIRLRVEPVLAVPPNPDRLLLPFEDEESNLAMCSRLVERIGAHLHLESGENSAGVTVSIPRFPYAAQEGLAR